MFKEIDKKIKLDMMMTFIATFISILFVTSSYIWHDYASGILSILIDIVTKFI